MKWYGLEVISVHEPDGPPIDEFVDERFVEDWLVIESSVFLVSAPTEDRARALIEEELAPTTVNVFGQTVRQRVVATDLCPIADWEFPAREDELVLEVHSKLWTTIRGTDPVRFLNAERPAPDALVPMIDPISFYEHVARYEELRGPLPKE
jgi:hypothetical protein